MTKLDLEPAGPHSAEEEYREADGAHKARELDEKILAVRKHFESFNFTFDLSSLLSRLDSAVVDTVDIFLRGKGEEDQTESERPRNP